MAPACGTRARDSWRTDQKRGPAGACGACGSFVLRLPAGAGGFESGASFAEVVVHHEEAVDGVADHLQFLDDLVH